MTLCHPVARYLVRISTDSQHFISEESTLPFISISVISNDHFILRRKFSSNLTLRSRALWLQEWGCSNVSAFPNLLHKSRVRILTSQCVSKFTTQITQEWECSNVSAFPNLLHQITRQLTLEKFVSHRKLSDDVTRWGSGWPWRSPN